MSSQVTMAARIDARLRAALAITALQVEDESEQHRGHGGWREGGETHFHVAVQSPDFSGKTRIAQHRMVHGALGDLMTDIHALRLTLSV